MGDGQAVAHEDAMGKARLGRQRYLEESLEELEALAVTATEAESFTAAVNAKAKAIEVRAELDTLRETKRRGRQKPKSLEQHKSEILYEVRRLRQGASEAGSFVAAANLLKLERELLAQDATERAEEAKRRREHLDEGGVLAELVTVIDRLPRDLRDQLRLILEDDQASVH